MGESSGRHSEKIQEILDCYVSLDPINHAQNDIEVFYDKTLRVIRWSCPCNPSREEAYLWQGAGKMETHTQSKHHLNYVEKVRPRTNAPTKPMKREAMLFYLSLSDKHLAGDINLILDPTNNVHGWICKCSPNVSISYSRESLKAHASSATHIDFVNARDIVFDPVVFWTEEHKLPIEMLKIVPNTGGKRATCMYCGYGLNINRREIERHLETKNHQNRVTEKELKDELKRMQGKVVDKEHRTPEVVVEKSNKRERGETSPAPPLAHPEKEKPVALVPEEKKRKSIRDQLRNECFVQIKIAQEEYAQQLMNARKESMEECIAELKRLDWKTIIKEQATEYVKNMIDDIINSESSEPNDK